MVLSDWSSSRIGSLWLAGAVVELLLVVTLRATGGLCVTMDDGIYRVGSLVVYSAADHLPSEEKVRFLSHRLAQDESVIREEARVAGRQYVTYRFSDSLWAVVAIRGERAQVITLSDAARREAYRRSHANALTAALSGIGPAIALLLLSTALFLLPVPLALLYVTGRWAVSRAGPAWRPGIR